MSIKITNEAPAGMKAGIKGSYHWVTQDMLDAVSRPEWRHILYVLCFMHSCVVERRKFGSIGWAIPYEYNTSDLNACVMFIINHFGAMESKAAKGGPIPLQWATVRYMVGEVQYGGKITDDIDRVLMATYCDAYFNQTNMDPNYKFYEGYPVPGGPGSAEIDFWRAEVEKLPQTDTPEIFGLNVNADITYRNNQTNELLGTIIDTQPKTGGGGGGLSREEVVLKIGEDMLSKLPDDFNMNIVGDCITKLGGMTQPLNIVLSQEIFLHRRRHQARAHYAQGPQARRRGHDHHVGPARRVPQQPLRRAAAAGVDEEVLDLAELGPLVRQLPAPLRAADELAEQGQAARLLAHRLLQPQRLPHGHHADGGPPPPGLGARRGRHVL